MSRRLKIFIVIALLVVSAVIIGASWRNHNKYTATSTKEAERGGPKTVVLTGTEQLSNTLLSSQFTATKEALTSFVQTKLGPSVTEAKISGFKLLNSGVIQFEVQTKNPSKIFQVTLDRNTYFDRIILTVPAYKYKETIPVYDQTGD